jgi:hypothetical protein
MREPSCLAQLADLSGKMETRRQPACMNDAGCYWDQSSA